MVGRFIGAESITLRSKYSDKVKEILSQKPNAKNIIPTAIVIAEVFADQNDAELEEIVSALEGALEGKQKVASGYVKASAHGGTVEIGKIVASLPPQEKYQYLGDGIRPVAIYKPEPDGSRKAMVLPLLNMMLAMGIIGSTKGMPDPIALYVERGAANRWISISPKLPTADFRGDASVAVLMGTPNPALEAEELIDLAALYVYIFKRLRDETWVPSNEIFEPINVEYADENENGSSEGGSDSAPATVYAINIPLAAWHAAKLLEAGVSYGALALAAALAVPDRPTLNKIMNVYEEVAAKVLLEHVQRKYGIYGYMINMPHASEACFNLLSPGLPKNDLIKYEACMDDFTIGEEYKHIIEEVLGKTPAPLSWKLYQCTDIRCTRWNGVRRTVLFLPHRDDILLIPKGEVNPRVTARLGVDGYVEIRGKSKEEVKNIAKAINELCGDELVIGRADGEWRAVGFASSPECAGMIVASILTAKKSTEVNYESIKSGLCTKDY